MKITYDKTAKMLSIRFTEKTSVESENIGNGIVLDFDENNQVVSLEVESPENFSMSNLSFETIDENHKIRKSVN